MQGNIRASDDRLTGPPPGGVDLVRDRIQRYAVEHPRFRPLGKSLQFANQLLECVHISSRKSRG